MITYYIYNLPLSDLAVIKALTQCNSSDSSSQQAQRKHEIELQNNSARIAREKEERSYAFQLANNKAMWEGVAAAMNKK